MYELISIKVHRVNPLNEPKVTANGRFFLHKGMQLISK